MSHPSQPPWWRRVWQSLVPPMPDFAGMLAAQADNLCSTMNALADYLGSSNLDQAAQVNGLVDQGHALRDRTLGVLYGSFITPIDREDIYKLAMAIDHVLDYLKNTVREVEVLQVQADDWMQRMAKELTQGSDSLAKGLACFGAGQAQAVRRTVLTRDAERHVEDLYRDALENMFQGETYDRLMDDSTPSAMGDCLDFVVARIKRREVYRHLSNAADRLAHAGEALRNISTKYDEGRSKSAQ
jgi:uncharacterized protein